VEIAGLTLGVREGVIGLIAFVALYMLVVLLRMRRLRSKAPPPVVAPPIMAPEPSLIPPVSVAPEPAQEPPAVADIPWNEPPERNRPSSVPVTPALAQEVAQLREEVDALRGEVAALRDDMLHELAHMRAAQTVSPIYGDAMQMAVSGYEPAVIAERCGIARAEAELVVALAKSQDQ